jgi:hypothetical protein
LFVCFKFSPQHPIFVHIDLCSSLST